MDVENEAPMTEETFKVKALVVPAYSDYNERMWLVHWEGYDDEKDFTWELESSLKECVEMINERAEDYGLTTSSLPEVMGGCNLANTDVQFNKDNWVTVKRVCSVISMYRGAVQYASQVPVIGLNGSWIKDKPTRDTLYILPYISHFYVVYYRASLKMAYISDGLGLCTRDPAILKDLGRRLGLRLVAVRSSIQQKVDHCGAAAVAIALEMLRVLKDPEAKLGDEITFGHATYSKLVDQMHKMPSASNGGWKSISERQRFRYCQYCHEEKFPMKADPRKLRMHERQCKERMD